LFGKERDGDDDDDALRGGLDETERVEDDDEDMEGKVSLANIVIAETVSYAEKLDQSPPDYRSPSTLSSTMSRPLKPRRIPIYSSGTSTLSRLAASRIPISALKGPQSSTSGLSSSTQGGERYPRCFSANARIKYDT
jgi:hypothetical protein